MTGDEVLKYSNNIVDLMRIDRENILKDATINEKAFDKNVYTALKSIDDVIYKFDKYVVSIDLILSSTELKEGTPEYTIVYNNLGRLLEHISNFTSSDVDKVVAISKLCREYTKRFKV